MANDAPKREKPVTGFYLKTKMVKTIIAIAIGVGAILAAVYGFADIWFWSEEEQAVHQEDFDEHETEFTEHKHEFDKFRALNSKDIEILKESTRAIIQNQQEIGRAVRARRSRLRGVDDEGEPE